MRDKKYINRRWIWPSRDYNSAFVETRDLESSGPDPMGPYPFPSLVPCALSNIQVTSASRDSAPRLTARPRSAVRRCSVIRDMTAASDSQTPSLQLVALFGCSMIVVPLRCSRADPKASRKILIICVLCWFYCLYRCNCDIWALILHRCRSTVLTENIRN